VQETSQTSKRPAVYPCNIMTMSRNWINIEKDMLNNEWLTACLFWAYKSQTATFSHGWSQLFLYNYSNVILYALKIFCNNTLNRWAPAGFFPGVGKLKGLGNGSFSARFRGKLMVGIWGWSPQKLTCIENNA